MRFTWEYLFENMRTARDCGYRFLTCADYVREKRSLGDQRVVVNRVDVDFNFRRTARIADVFERLDVKATFFIRLHAPEYNPLSFEGYRVVRSLADAGHEIGYHSEVMDLAAIWNEDPETCLRRDLDVMERFYGLEVRGAASHRGTTAQNNLDFWQERKPSDFGLLYEGYDREPAFNLFHESLYVSDSEWTRWKCYKNGVLVPGDRRSIAEHAAAGVERIIYSLVHPDTFYDHHFYE